MREESSSGLREKQTQFIKLMVSSEVGSDGAGDQYNLEFFQNKV
jgi:hypothetical protein